MSDPGEVDRAVVIVVLKAQGVGVSVCLDDSTGETLTIAKGDRVESQKLPNRVRRRMLHYLQHHYGIPIHYFFHPEMMPPPSKEPSKVTIQ